MSMRLIILGGGGGYGGGGGRGRRNWVAVSHATIWSSSVVFFLVLIVFFSLGIYIKKNFHSVKYLRIVRADISSILSHGCPLFSSIVL